MALRFLDPAGAARVRKMCEAMVPGSAGVHPEDYVDALLGELGEGEREAARADLDAVAAAAGRGDLAALAGTPAFERARLFAAEAYYSDFVAAAATDAGAWARIDFRFPLTERLRKDWSFIGIEG